PARRTRRRPARAPGGSAAPTDATTVEVNRSRRHHPRVTITAPEKLVRRTTSIPQLFFRRVTESADREAYRYPVGPAEAAGPSGSVTRGGTGWRSMSWRQAGARVRAIAGGLLSLGLAREARVGILCSTRLEWILADLGVLSAGGATT